MSTIDEAAREAEIENAIPDADEVNAKFFAPFQGMKEMYALQKGLEIGFEAGVEWAQLNPPAEVAGLIEALEFYKNQSLYSRYYDVHEDITEIEHDNGHTARQALAAYRGKVEK